jgi:CRP-like cAMP-binding protein
MSELDAQVARFASPMERLLYLSSTSLMSDVHSSALATVAQRSKERLVRAGTTLFSPDQPATELFFVVEGEVSVCRGGVQIQKITPPGAVGFFPVFSKVARENIVTTTTGCVMLVLSTADILELFEEDFEYLMSSIRSMAGNIADAQAKLESLGELERSEPEMGEWREREMDFVQRLIRLREGPYAGCSLDALTSLARESCEIRYQPGDVIWNEGDEGGWGLHIASGVVRCHSDAPPRDFRMGSESVVGYLQANAQRPRAYTCVAETEIVALKADIEAAYDMIEDNLDLGMSFLSFMADMLMDLHVRIAGQTGFWRAKGERPLWALLS